MHNATPKKNHTLSRHFEIIGINLSSFDPAFKFWEDLKCPYYHSSCYRLARNSLSGSIVEDLVQYDLDVLETRTGYSMYR